MDPALSTLSPDNSDVKPAFRKPVHDAANRKYRRHTPVGGSDSSSSGGSPKRRSRSPIYSDDRRRKDDGRGLEREADRNWSGRGSESHRAFDRQSHGTSHDYAKNSNYSRQHRHADEEDRGYPRSSRSGRESRNGTNSDYTRHDSSSDRSREVWRSGDKYSRDKSEGVGHRSKDKYHRHSDKDSDRDVLGCRHIELSRDDIKIGEHEKHRDREARDERRDRRRSPDNYKNDQRSSHDELKERAKDSTIGRESGSSRWKETLWSGGSKENDVLKEKRKHDDRESHRRKEKDTREAEAEVKNENNSLSTYRARDERNDRYLDKIVNEEKSTSLKKLKLHDSEDDEKPSSSSKQSKGTAEKFTSESVSANVNQAETAQDLNAAKVAAMKAAELVNRNLGGGSFLSTDQKKKLLWGNKKNTSTEESGNRWDLQLFPDRERQEKFNKLMGVKGDAIPERKPDEKDAEKQEKLQMDLEKQYTAGLRRRDGRTVGLGL